MTRRMVAMVLGGVLLIGGVASLAFSGDLKVIQTRKAKDLAITLLNESGQWTQGNNDFVLEFTSAKTKEPVDVGKVSLNTSMAMPGMTPMLVGAILSPDKTPGRYTGTINFQDSGARQVSVTWDGPAGKGSTKFTVSVR